MIATQWSSQSPGTYEIPIDHIHSSTFNPRKRFDEVELAGLAESLKNDGQQVPLIVRPTLIGVEIIEGERRWRAARMAGFFSLRCELRPSMDDPQAMRIALLANIQRAQLNPIEEALAYRQLLAVGAFESVEAMAEALGRDKRCVYQTLQLEELIPEAQSALIDGRITYSHAALIVREQEQARVLAACFEPETIYNGSSSETVERLVSEKQLRSWIRTHLREEGAGGSGLGAGNGNSEADAQASLERAGDSLLGDEADDGEQQGSGSGVQGSGNDAEKAEPEGDADAKEDLELEGKRLKDLEKVLKTVAWPLDPLFLKLLTISAARNRTAPDAVRRICDALGIRHYEPAEFMTMIQAVESDDVDERDGLARILVAVALVYDTYAASPGETLEAARLIALDKPVKKADKKPAPKKKAKK
jgi:ParB family chromosome partitioning protein